MTLCAADILGANPVNIQWNVVRGDTATLRIDFLEDNEVTYLDVSTWAVEATAYDSKTETSYELQVSFIDEFVVILAEPNVTSQWGSGTKYRINELNFDVEVTLPDGSIWTPVIGTISVISDVTGGAL
tara:strand:- start:58 stop:441 length:384 start_codon:yes stop_codon:yes gene_type:complete